MDHPQPRLQYFSFTTFSINIGMALPPYLPGTIDPTQWTGAQALANEMLVTPPDFPQGPTTGTFSGGIYTSPQGASPTLTYKTVFNPRPNRRYVIKLRARKIYADPALPAYGSAIKPSFILSDGSDGTNYTASSAITSAPGGRTPGVKNSGAAGNIGYTPNGQGEFDTSAWVVGQWYNLSGYWDTSSTAATLLRIRVRVNRAADGVTLADGTIIAPGTNLMATQGSNSIYEISLIEFRPQIFLSDLYTEFGGYNGTSGRHALSDYYRGDVWVPNTPQNTDVPASTGAPIKFSDFFETAKEAGNTAPNWDATPGSLGSATVGTPFSATVSATDPQGLTVTYTVFPGSTLPPGLSLSSSGTISGTPTAAGSYTFALKASDGKLGRGGVFSLTVTP